MKMFYFLPKLVVLPLNALIFMVSFEEGAVPHAKSSSEASLTGGFGSRIKVIFYIFYIIFFY